LLQKIQPSDSDTDLACDLIIEAVFENSLKQITIETEKVIRQDVIYASNTSTIPISQLAKASTKTDKFIGLHFLFSKNAVG
jgi:3-hydroxyacyl-CoA dehydrogenase/enoyl-CoA hydratase/3-hydroxybutyryl-CoA epimerase